MLSKTGVKCLYLRFLIYNVYFKLWKALFKKGLESNCKYKNILEFNIEKDGGIIFKKKPCKPIFLSHYRKISKIILYFWCTNIVFVDYTLVSQIAGI